MKNKIIIILLCLSLIFLFGISAFATGDDPANKIVFDNNDYYLFNYYNNSSSSIQRTFSIYVRSYANKNKLYVDELGYTINVTDYIYGDNILLPLINDDDDLLLTMILKNYNVTKVANYNEDIGAIPYTPVRARSSVFNCSISYAFERGWYAVDTPVIDPNADGFNDIKELNNLGTPYFDNAFYIYHQCFNNALNYANHYSEIYYDSNDNSIPIDIYIYQSAHYKEALCKSIYNMLYYEFGFNTSNLTLNDIYSSEFGKVGEIHSNVVTGDYMHFGMTSLYYFVPFNRINYQEYLINGGEYISLDNAYNNSYNKLNIGYYLSWLPYEVSTTLLIFASSIFAGGCIFAIKKLFLF